MNTSDTPIYVAETDDLREVGVDFYNGKYIIVDYYYVNDNQNFESVESLYFSMDYKLVRVMTFMANYDGIQNTTTNYKDKNVTFKNFPRILYPEVFDSIKEGDIRKMGKKNKTK